jgi:RNA polymerase sigma-70 factor (ECF subfamily)
MGAMEAEVQTTEVVVGGEVAVGDEPERFEDFFDAQRPRLFAALCLVTGSRQEAEELSQDAFLRIWERWDRVVGMEEPVGYLFRVAMNLFRRRLRRTRVVSTLRLPQRELDDAYATVDARDELVRALRDLTPRQRGAVVLTTMLGYSSEEAGAVLGIQASTVRVLAMNARETLRRKVGDPS